MAALLKQTGYAGKPEGMATRVAAELERGLPLRLGPEEHRAFARFFDGPVLMEQARREAGLRLNVPPKGSPPASQVFLKPRGADVLLALDQRPALSASGPRPTF